MISYLSKVRTGSQSRDHSYVVVSYNLYQSSSDTVHLSTHVPSVNNVVTLNKKKVFLKQLFSWQKQADSMVPLQPHSKAISAQDRSCPAKFFCGGHLVWHP